MNNDVIQISWHGLDPSAALEERIREEIARLSDLYPRASSCRVVVERPHHHHHQGSHFVVKVELSVPGKQLVAGRDPAEHEGYDDAFVACAEAFSAMRRQIEHFLGARRDVAPVKTRRQKRHAS